jgi:uncharacterized membrane protein
MRQAREVKLAAAAVLVAIGVAGTATAVQGAVVEKCYGISRAGQNDCANGTHSCGGRATKDYSPYEWKNVNMGTCGGLGGTTTPPK